MRCLFRRALPAAGIALSFFALALPALAAETSNSEFVIIREGDVFPEDLYTGAIRVVVQGTIEGDLVAFAAQDVVIEGTVTGSVTAVSPSVVVGGVVEGSLRATGNRLEVSGVVERDVVAAVATAELFPTSNVGGDVILWAWSAGALGTIGQDLTGVQRNLDLAGAVEGDVEVTVNRLEVVGPLTVGGDLGYRSSNEATGLDNADVDGAVVAKSPLPPNLRVRALSLLGRFMVVLFLTIAALTTAYGWPLRTSAAIAEVGRRPLRRWATGALIVFAPFLAVLVTALIVGLAPPAAAFPLLVVLLPVVLALFGITLALGLVAGIPVVGWLGGVLFKRLDLYGAILSGSLVVGVVWYLPLVGWLVPLLALPLGLGAWMAAWRQDRAPSETPSSVST